MQGRVFTHTTVTMPGHPDHIVANLLGKYAENVAAIHTGGAMEIKGLKQLQDKLKKLEQTKSVPVTTLLNPRFVSACSRFSDAQELFDASGLDISSEAALEKNRGALSEFIRQNTTYSGWSEMLQAAGTQYFKSQLKL
jgi:hypothetical protein